jgi:hypothetical protein
LRRFVDRCLATPTLTADESLDVRRVKSNRVQHTYGREKPLSTKAVDGPHAQMQAMGNLVFCQQSSHDYLIYMVRLADAG